MQQSPLNPAEGFFFGDDYLSLPRDPQPWVIKGLIPVGGAVNMFGNPKTGKSFAALGIAHAVATGQPYWLDPKFEVVKPGRVAYLQIDTPRGLWTHRLDKMKAGGYDFSGVGFCDTIVAPYPFNILIPDHQQWLKTRLASISPILVVIDTLREVHAGDENDSTVMKNVVAALTAACTPAAMLLLSHSRKGNQMNAGGGDDLMTDNRGSGYVAGRMDTIVKLTAKHLLYKGRAVGDGKLKVRQHPTLGLLEKDEDLDNLTAVVAMLVRDYPEESINALANRLLQTLPTVSKSTAQRRLKEAREKLLEGEN